MISHKNRLSAWVVINETSGVIRYVYFGGVMDWADDEYVLMDEVKLWGIA